MMINYLALTAILLTACANLWVGLALLVIYIYIYKRLDNGH